MDARSIHSTIFDADGPSRSFKLLVGISREDGVPRRRDRRARGYRLHST